MKSQFRTVLAKPNLSIQTRLRAIAANAGIVNYDVPDPARVLGLSTSHFTGAVDWEKAKGNGIKFAIIKAQNGMFNPVRFFVENYTGAKKVGILVGAYTWLYQASQYSPGGQAREFARFLRDYPLDIPPCIDFEWSPDGKKFNCDTSDLWGFVQPFEDAYGKKPMIYTAPGYWSEFGADSSLWADYPLWQAQYNQGNFDKISPWGKYDFLQFTQKGKGIDYGVPLDGEKACELNYWRGTMDELLTFCGKVQTPPVEPPAPPSATDTLDFVDCRLTVNHNGQNVYYDLVKK